MTRRDDRGDRERRVLIADRGERDGCDGGEDTGGGERGRRAVRGDSALAQPRCCVAR